jgi:hypothetical protein
MAKKRFTDLDKWKKPFFKSMSPEYKLFWLYLLDDCDHCGIWHIDQEVAEIRLGVKLSLQKARGLFAERVVEFDGGTKWFIPDFIGFQYGRLDNKNKMCNAVIPTLEKYHLMEHLSPINGVKVTVTVKEKDIGGVGDEPLPRTIEHCLEIAMRDERWVESNKTNKHELQSFNLFLERSGEYEKIPKDYKRHFSAWKTKNPQKAKPNVSSIAKAVQALRNETPSTGD